MARLAGNLRAFGDAALGCGVGIVLETHDDFSTGAQVAELLAATAHPAVHALWDLHHPYRRGESPATTFERIGGATHHVHVKDGSLGRGYTLLGEGDVPLFPMLDLLLDGGYSGPVSLEWEKRWEPQIADPEIAFPQYAAGLRAYLEARPSRGR
jgi:sugar phosphate isomerase/epimerase